eukprot:COSAG02_NODE_26965_length_620_cov_0.859885_2_plen_22_part_01
MTDARVFAAPPRLHPHWLDAVC